MSTVGGLEYYGQIAFQAAIGEATIRLRINLIAAPKIDESVKIASATASTTGVERCVKDLGRS